MGVIPAHHLPLYFARQADRFSSDEAGGTVAKKKLFEKANHLKRWDAKPLILLQKAVGKQSCRAGHSVIAISGDVGGNGTSVSRVPHVAEKIRLTEVLF
jgi:hypothetical protein